MKASVVPYSSTVGSSILITLNDKPVCQLALLLVGGDTPEEHHAKSEALAHAISHAINNGVFNAQPASGSVPNKS